MKKCNLLFTFAFVVSSAFAQDALISKKGEAYLPVAGDWAISIDASPFLKYAGNFIGGSGLNVAPTFEPIINQRIVGKYFISPSEAYRGGIRLGFNSSPTNSGVAVFPATIPATYVNNVATAASSNIGITAGKEWRRGTTRLQGFYGGEAGIGIATTTNSFKNGNDITATNGLVNTTISTGTFQFGLRAFIGAEYFIFPKIAIGGEFGWGLTFNSTGEAKTTTEEWDGATTAVKKTETTNHASNSSLNVDADHNNSLFGPAGTLRLTLHF